MVRNKFIQDSSSTQLTYLGLPVVRNIFVWDASGTQQIYLGFQWYAANVFKISVVRSNVKGGWMVVVDGGGGLWDFINMQQIYVGFQWYTANLYRLPMVRSNCV